MGHSILYSLLVLCSIADSSCSDGLTPAIAARLSWGSGEKITKIGDLDPGIQQQVNRDFGKKNVAVGFLYENWNFCGLDVWTANGRFVLFSRDKYWELNDDEWRKLISTVPESKFHAPLWYKVPSAYLVGILVLGAIGCYNGPRLYNGWTARRKVKFLEADPSYLAAVSKILSVQSSKYSARIDAEVFRQEVKLLIGGGVSEEHVIASLMTLLTEECVRREKSLRRLVIDASEFADGGNAEKCDAILRQVQDDLNEFDDVDIPVLNLITRLRDSAGKDVDSWRMMWRELTQRNTPRLSD